jgi:hypothetical protein
MEAYGGVDVQLHELSISAVSGQLHAPAALLRGNEPLIPIW